MGDGHERVRRRFVAATLVLALAVLLAGCGGSGDPMASEAAGGSAEADQGAESEAEQEQAAADEALADVPRQDQVAFVALASVVGKLRAQAATVAVKHSGSPPVPGPSAADLRRVAGLAPEDSILKSVRTRLLAALRRLPPQGAQLGPRAARAQLRLTASFRDALARYVSGNPEVGVLVPD